MTPTEPIVSARTCCERRNRRQQFEAKGSRDWDVRGRRLACLRFGRARHGRHGHGRRRRHRRRLPCRARRHHVRASGQRAVAKERRVSAEGRRLREPEPNTASHLMRVPVPSLALSLLARPNCRLLRLKTVRVPPVPVSNRRGRRRGRQHRRCRCCLLEQLGLDRFRFRRAVRVAALERAAAQRGGGG